MTALRILAAISLLACVALPFLFFWGYISERSFRTMLAIFSVAWFLFATMAMRRRTRA